MPLFFPISAGKSAWNSVFSMQWETVEQTTASGLRRAISNQKYPRCAFDMTFNLLTSSQTDELLGFYVRCHGNLLPFLYKDSVHYHVDRQELTKGSDGLYQCVIVHGGYLMPAPYVDNVHVFIDGVETQSYTVNDGKLAVSGSGIVTASYDYYWKVVFADGISVSQLFKNADRVALKLQTVRE